MEAQEAISVLGNHLLGNDWTITDPVSGGQANDIIVEEIKSRYKGVSESPVNKWRRSRVNRRCEFCQHYDVNTFVRQDFGQESGFCRAKSKIVNGYIHRPFCKVFQLKSFYGKDNK